MGLARLFRVDLSGSLTAESVPWFSIHNLRNSLVGLRPSFSAQVRSHGKPGQVGEPGAPVPIPCGSVARSSLRLWLPSRRFLVRYRSSS
jgi:hypothetical protein